MFNLKRVYTGLYRVLHHWLTNEVGECENSITHNSSHYTHLFKNKIVSFPHFGEVVMLVTWSTPSLLDLRLARAGVMQNYFDTLLVFRYAGENQFDECRVLDDICKTMLA